MNKQIRSDSVKFEIRAVDADKGIFEGYASVFGVVDTYGTSIQKGAFTKTLQERKDKIKVMWNHDEDEPIGKPLEMREDDYGLFVRAQLIRGVQKAEEALLLMKEGVINTLSIGFSIPRGKDSIVDGVRQIHEVKLYEFSPVVFESNDAATINSVRSEDFNDSLKEQDLRGKHGELLWAFDETMEDIRWGDSSGSDSLALATKAVDDFATAYKSWFADYIAYKTTGELRKMTPETVGEAVRAFMLERKFDNSKLAMNTTLTVDEVHAAKRGELHSEKMLTQFDDAVSEQYRKQRRSDFEQIAARLRGNMNEAERTQLSALLAIQPHESTGGDEAANKPSNAHLIKQLRAEIKDLMGNTNE